MGIRSITKIECDVLYRKYRKAGLDPDQANYRINTVKSHLKNLVEKLKDKNRPDNEINLRFQEEFEKICMKAEGMS